MSENATFQSLIRTGEPMIWTGRPEVLRSALTLPGALFPLLGLGFIGFGLMRLFDAFQLARAYSSSAFSDHVSVGRWLTPAIVLSLAAGLSILVAFLVGLLRDNRTRFGLSEDRAFVINGGALGQVALVAPIVSGGGLSIERRQGLTHIVFGTTIGPFTFYGLTAEAAAPAIRHIKILSEAMYPLAKAVEDQETPKRENPSTGRLQ